MVSWSSYSLADVAPEWNSWVEHCPNHNIFQTRNWAEFKALQGWKPMFYTARSSDNHLIALSLILDKTLAFKHSFAWSPGGILFYPQQFQVLDLIDLFGSFKKSFLNDHHRSLLRMNFLQEHDHQWAHDLNKSFLRPLNPINSGFTNIITVQNNLETFMETMSSKHRYYTKKSLKTPLAWDINSGQLAFDKFYGIYDKMLSEKKLGHLKLKAENLLQMLQCLPKNHFFMTGYSHDKAVTSCLILTFNKKAHYYLAATCQEGRKISSSYAMVYKLYEYLREKCFSELDFGGIAPANCEAHGVDHFKNGFGGKIIEYLGEWETSQSRGLRYFMNFILQYKK